MFSRVVGWVASSGMVVFLALPAFGAGAVQGLFVADGVTGRSVTAHGWTDELIYVGQLSVGFGAGGRAIYQPPGWYSVNGSAQPPGFPAGTYALFTLRFDGIPAFSCRTNLELPGGSTVVDHQELRTPAHCSVMYNVTYTEWAPSPWIWGDSFCQTFVATTSHVTRVATKLAGKSGDHYWLRLNYAIYQPDGGPPSTWPQISPVRNRWLSGGTDPIIHILAVQYKSSEVSLVPGQTYAVRFWRAPDSQSTSFALVARPDIGDGYAGGHLYAGDTARTDLDAYAYVSGGEPNTIVNHAPVVDLQFLELVGSSGRYGQTFQASGTSLAGVDIVYATGDGNPPSLPVTFRVYTGVGGAQIGPSKLCYGVPGFYEARAAAVWREGEVPLVPGQMYYIEWTSTGFNTWRTNEDLPGQAYVDREARPTSDLMMSIAEYESPPPPPPVASFVGSPLTGTVPLAVQFTDQSTGQITSRSWTFGDGGASTEVNPVHTYTAEGTHTVSLTVTGPGGSDTKTRANYVNVQKSVGDFDGDGDMDQDDFGHLQECLTGPGIPQMELSCRDAYLDMDDDVDQNDVEAFRACMSGPNVPLDPACGD